MCGISNKLDGSENSLICSAKELQDIVIAYGQEATSHDDSDSGDPFVEGRDQESGEDAEADSSESSDGDDILN